MEAGWCGDRATALAAVRPVVRIIGRRAAGAPAMRVADVGP